MASDGMDDEIARNLDDAVLAERGAMKEIVVEDASFRHENVVDQDKSSKEGPTNLIAANAVSSPNATNPVLVKGTQNDTLAGAEPLDLATPTSTNAGSIDHVAESILPSTSNTKQIADQDAPEEYGDEDGGVIRCICECDDDDGFTIQCDLCLVWQHCACFGMSQASVPEEYHCERCNPRPVDVEFAKAHQQKRKEAEARKASIERSIRRQGQNTAVSISAASAGLEGSSASLLMESDGSEMQRKGQQGGISRSRKPSQQLDLSNINFSTSAEGLQSLAATPGSARSYKRRGGAPKTVSRKPSMVDSPGSTSTTPRTVSMMSSVGNNVGLTTPAGGRADDRMDLDDISTERMEAWQVEFTPTSQNIIAKESVLTSLTSVMMDYDRKTPLKAERGSGNRFIAPVHGKKVKILSQLSPSTAESIKETILAAGQTSVGCSLTPIGNECLPIQIDTPSLSDCTQRTYVKLISEMASASIFNSLLQVNSLPGEPQRTWSANRAFSKPVMHGLFADVSIPAGCFISEYIGELSSADDYRQNPVNQFISMGTTKPGVHLFPPPLNLAIDARRFGNTSRFARFSCHPNAVLRPIIVKSRKEEDDTDQRREIQTSFASPKGKSSDVAQFGIFAITDIPRTHEVTLGWEWDDTHIVHLLPLLVRDPTLGMMSLVRPLSSSSSSVHSTGNQRLLERERRHAAIAVLVEKGEFPYAGLLFSQKMNSILTVLLGSCLCACIGSAPASSNHGGGVQSGGSTASSNNVKRQDCAIAQMLRLSQGMNLLNVNISGSNNTTNSRRSKSKVPDFEPLVGKRRWWRPDAMPLSPTSLPDDHRNEEEDNGRIDDLYCKLRVPYRLLPGGIVGRVEEEDFDRAIKTRELDIMQRKNALHDEEGSEDEENDDGDSDNSVLTIPLDRNSELDEDDEEGEDDGLLLQDNNVTIAKGESGGSYLTRTALPPKKRVTGTRLKAVNSAEEDSDVEYKGKKKKKKRRDVQREEKEESRSKVALMSSRGQKSDKRKKKKAAYEPSSPLTSAPSQENSDESDGSPDEESQDNTPTPQQQSRPKKSMKREGSDELNGRAEAKKRKEDDVEAKKKSLLAQKRRHELMGDLDNDSETSSGREARRIEAEVGQDKRRTSSSPSKKQARKKTIQQRLHSDDSEDEEEQMERQPSESVQMEKMPMPEMLPPIPIEQVVPPIIAAPPTTIEVPKAKLSLAEYKKRLAERRTTSSNTQSNLSTPLSTPGIAVASPLKTSLSTTPSSIPASTSVGQTAYAFPGSTFVSEPATMASTTTSIKTEFAPPAPRFPRPMTPPRDASRGISLGAVSNAEKSPTTLRSTGSEGLSTSVEVPYLKQSPVRDVETVESEERVLPSASAMKKSIEGTIDSSKDHKMANEIDKDSTIPFGGRNDEAVAPMLQGTDSSTETPSVLSTGHASRSDGLSQSVDSLPGASLSHVKPTITFNPPKAPRAFVTSAVPAVTSPIAVPIRSVAHDTARNQQKPSLSLRHPSSPPPPPFLRTPSALISPSITNGSSHNSASASGPASSINDFANVPKGPARMREREREREREIRDTRERERGEDREYREPIPLPRERESWEMQQRDRDWDAAAAAAVRDRERDYHERDYFLLREAAYRRDRSHSSDRRRFEEDMDDLMDFTPTRSVPPFVPRGGGGSGRGGFNSIGRGGIAPWAGRARTRGRGSRGAWH